MNGLTKSDQEFLRRIVKCDIRRQRIITHVFLVCGVVMMVAMLIGGIIMRREYFVGAAPMGAMVFVMIAVGRYQFLRVFQIVRKLLDENRKVEAIDPKTLDVSY